MTQEESAALMNDFEFRGRIKVCALKYADALFASELTEPARNTKVKWAQETFLNPDARAIQLHPPVVMDAQVQTDGAAIIDDALQSSVEAVVNKQF